MEDILLGRQLQSQTRVVSLPNGQTTRLVGADPRRTRLVFGTSALGSVWVGPRTAGVGNQSGFLVAAGQGLVIFTVEEMGNAIFEEWDAFPSGAGLNICFTESVLQRDK